MKTLIKPRFTILIFDSGVGGLSVYDNIRKILPDLHYVYVFDNAAFPYGRKNKRFIISRVYKIISSVHCQFPLTVAVIACNTVSTLFLPFLQKNFSFPIVGVVPAIKSAAGITKNGVIGLLATKNTISSPYVGKLIECFAINCQVVPLGSSELVKLAETKLRGEIISLMDLHRILQPWSQIPVFPDTIVLGCTHFPLLQEELFTVLPSGACLLDSGQAVAHRIAWILNYKTLNEQSGQSFELSSALCTSFTKDIEKLLPSFQRHGFKTIKQLSL